MKNGRNPFLSGRSDRFPLLTLAKMTSFAIDDLRAFPSVGLCYRYFPSHFYATMPAMFS
jgi:hypothetical protein